MSTYTAWKPGLESEIPHNFREMETIYDPAYVFNSFDEVNEIARETGLDPVELIVFKPHRLVLHELILRVTADIIVIEGEDEETLGINFRNIAQNIFDRYILPEMRHIEDAYGTMRCEVEALTLSELKIAMLAKASPERTARPSLISRLFSKKPAVRTPATTWQEREFEMINVYKQRGLAEENEVSAAVFRSIYRVLASIATTRGFIGNNPDYLKEICSQHACNYLGSHLIGRKVGEIVSLAIEKEGYEKLPDSQSPILISLKGASAAGKSSLRPMLSRMMTDLGIEAHGYGTISPDIWRRMLLNYEALGDAYKYAGRFTSYEVNIIDNKLDHYIRAKAEQHKSIPHLMVDRFRFDSFASEKIAKVLHNTYVKYIDTMYMYFVVTPPEATVERGWERGLERGRYKAVEDFLGHCIEAYEGMPKLLFKWLANDKPHFFFEFLNNSVNKGEYPTLIARGSQAGMDIYQPESLIDIDRFQRINVMALSPDELYSEPQQLAVEHNLNFLRQCIAKIDSIRFIDLDSEQVYLQLSSGEFSIVDETLFARKLKKEPFNAIITALAPDLLP